MFIETVCRLLQDYGAYLVLLVLGFSAGVFAPIKCKQRCAAAHAAERDEAIAECGAEGEAECRAGVKHITSKQWSNKGLRISKREEVMMNTSKAEVMMNTSKAEDEKGEDGGEMVQKMKQHELGSNPGLTKSMKEGEGGSKERDSSPGPFGWLRSLSRRGSAQESNPRLEGLAQEKGVQRKGSLTCEEVKELADAFIARVRQRRRVQRQESYELRQDNLARQASYQARLDRSS